jgi:outer membrane protein assembly factor BamB
MPRLMLTLGLIATAALPVTAQVAPGRDSIPTRTALARLGLEREWTTTLPVGNVDERINHANLHDNTLFAQTNRGLVHAIDAATGRRLWSRRLTEGPTLGFDISTNSDQVFVTLQDTLYCLERGSGHILWTVRLEAMPSTGTVADEEVVAVGLRTGKIVAYTTRDHSRDNPVPGRSPGSFAWAWQTQGIVDAAPIISPEVVVFGSEDNRVYAATRRDKNERPTLLYRYVTQGPVIGHLTPLGRRTVVVPCADYNLYAIDLYTGANRWIIPTSAPISTQPLVIGTDVVAINDDGRLLIIDGREGTIRGDSQTNSRLIRAASPTRIYLTTSNHDLEIADRQTGQIVASARDTVQRAGLTIRQLSIPVVNTEHDRLFLVSPDGILYAIREIGRIEPSPLRDPNWPAFGTVPPEGFRSDADELLSPSPDPEPNPDAPANVPPPPDDLFGEEP